VDHLAAPPPRDTSGESACAPSSSDPQIACSLGAGDLADRVQRWRRLLAGSAPHRRADGAVQVTLGLERLPDLTALIVDEVRCCPFFTFTLTVTHAGGRLDAGAPAEARPLLDELFLDAGQPR
jgi:hypothetical protein